MSTYRPEFLDALTLLAEAFDDVVAAGCGRPVLVGGAVVEFYTGGAVVSGDFDVVTPARHELEQALLRRGFERPSGPQMLMRGLLHRKLQIGVEVVSGTLFDGNADEDRMRLIAFGRSEVAMPAIEDMIADRLGQYSSNETGHREMLEQAIILYRIATSSLEISVDREYLSRRIEQETLRTYGLKFLIEQANVPDHS
ncbi:MAG TPA: hypothetical protein VI113_00900 [Alphaproteobacteria bacterium]